MFFKTAKFSQVSKFFSQKSKFKVKTQEPGIAILVLQHIFSSRYL